LVRVNDGNTAANVAFTETNGRLYASYTGANSHEQVLLLREDVGLAVGEVLSVDASFPSNSVGYDFGLVVASSVAPVGLASGASGDLRSGSGSDWISISVRPNQDAMRLNKILGTSVVTSGLGEKTVQEATVSTLFIERVSQTEFKLGYTTTTNEVVVLNTIVVPEGSQMGKAFGFYADLRSNATTLGGLDNLAVYTVPDPAARGSAVFISSLNQKIGEPAAADTASRPVIPTGVMLATR
jgi:hypothetical protein